MSELKKDPMREALDAAAQKTAIKNLTHCNKKIA